MPPNGAEEIDNFVDEDEDSALDVDGSVGEEEEAEEEEEEVMEEEMSGKISERQADETQKGGEGNKLPCYLIKKIRKMMRKRDFSAESCAHVENFLTMPSE